MKLVLVLRGVFLNQRQKFACRKPTGHTTSAERRNLAGTGRAEVPAFLAQALKTLSHEPELIQTAVFNKSSEMLPLNAFLSLPQLQSAHHHLPQEARHETRFRGSPKPVLS